METTPTVHSTNGVNGHIRPKPRVWAITPHDVTLTSLTTVLGTVVNNAVKRSYKLPLLTFLHLSLFNISLSL